MARPESKPPGPKVEAPFTAPLAVRADDEEVLATEAAGGNREAFERLIARYQDRVYTLLCKIIGSSSEAEDLTQETFLKAYRGLAGFRRGARFYTWLFRIAVNTGYSRGRQLQRKRSHERVSLDEVAWGEEHNRSFQEAASGVRPEARLEEEYVRSRVREALSVLDPDHRTVILLRDMEGLDYDAIAEVLSVTRAAVKSRLHRARLQLAHLLRDLQT